MIEAIRNLVSKGDVLQGEKRNIGIAVIAIVLGLRYFEVEVVDEQYLSLVDGIGTALAIIGTVYAKIRK